MTSGRYRRRLFTVDGLDVNVPGWTDGPKRNGWHMPIFEPDAVERIGAALRERGHGERLFRTEGSGYRDAGWIYYGPSTDDRGHHSPAFTFRTVSGQQLTGARIGAGGWCWYPID